ncbi:hypothetical protein JCM10212_004046 [Sporobolomyces blumeae]
MPPAASKSKAYSNPISTQADDAKYRNKYKELKVKVHEIEEDNTKLSVQILKSKKAIQRLRIQRAILYDRLQNTAAPTNPYALSSAQHLSKLASDPSASASSSSASSNAPQPPPPSILANPPYPLVDPSAPSLFLKQLDAQKLAAVQNAEGGFGATPQSGVAGEGQPAHELKDLLAAAPEPQGQARNGSTVAATDGSASNAAVPDPTQVTHPQPPIPNQTVPSSDAAQAMQVDGA